MKGLDHYARKIYGRKLQKKQLLAQTHQVFTLYQDSSTKQQYFLRHIELPACLRISEGIAERLASKYANVITPLQIVPLERHFQTCTYLLRAPHNVILLTTYLQIKRQCSQVIDSGFLVKLLDFLIKAWRVLEKNHLSTFGISQIGINDVQEFTLCDPQLYFEKGEKYGSKLSFGEWIVTLMKEFIGMHMKHQQLEQVQIQRFGQNLNDLRPLLAYLLCDSITPQFLQSSLSSIQCVCSDQNTTVTTLSNPEINEIAQKWEQSGNRQQQHAKLFCKNKIARIMIAFIMLGVLVTLGYFCFHFFTRKILCSEGQFLNDSNICLSCADGCVRCASSQPNRCMKCMVNMFLVLEEQEDKEGFCLKKCHGKLIALDVCIRDKPKPTPNQQTQINQKSYVHITAAQK